MGLADPSVPTFVLVVGPDDCFGCKLPKVFAALRRAQYGGLEGHRSVAVVGVMASAHSADTTRLAETLAGERLAAKSVLWPPGRASQLRSLKDLPAVFLLWNGTVVGEWKTQGARVIVERDELAAAAAALRQGKQAADRE